MKKMLFILLAALMLLPAGCGVSDQDLMDSIPTLFVQSEKDIKKTTAFGYDWSMTDRWGRSSSVIADTAHPLEAQENLTAVSISSEADVALYFSKIPDSVTVTYWSADDTNQENGTQVKTTFHDSAFHFTAPEISGQIVVLVNASWTSYDDVSGSVSYAFRTAE